MTVPLVRFTCSHCSNLGGFCIVYVPFGPVTEGAELGVEAVMDWHRVLYGLKKKVPTGGGVGVVKGLGWSMDVYSPL